MSHPVYPAFPTDPAPELGDVFDAGASGVWEYTSVGWAKKEIALNLVNPIWPGQVTSNSGL